MKVKIERSVAVDVQGESKWLMGADVDFEQSSFGYLNPLNPSDRDWGNGWTRWSRMVYSMRLRNYGGWQKKCMDKKSIRKGYSSQ